MAGTEPSNKWVELGGKKMLEEMSLDMDSGIGTIYSCKLNKGFGLKYPDGCPDWPKPEGTTVRTLWQ